jgi:hypothetical protein
VLKAVLRRSAWAGLLGNRTVPRIPAALSTVPESRINEDA